MGCNRSVPFAPTSKQIYSEGEPFKPIVMSKFISQRSGPITDFFEMNKALGSSDKHTMYYAKDKESGIFYTVKEVPKSQITQASLVSQEVTILSRMDHPNIIKLFETIESPRSFYIVYEYISGGALKEKIRRSGDETNVARFMADVLSGLCYIHKNGYVHCDLNMGNILLQGNDEEPFAKIVGFTFARKAEDGIAGLENIDPTYASPELLSIGHISPLTDIWSVGVILYNLLVGKLPFFCRNLDGILSDISSGRIDFENQNFQSLSVDARDLITRMLQTDPTNRITIEEALGHTWLQQAKTNFVINYNTLNRLKNFQIRSNLVKCFLAYYIFKINLEENEIVKCFKQIDQNFDGTVSKEELIYTFGQAGINVNDEIDGIMKNIDIDGSGFIDYSELKIVLTDWQKEIKKKNIEKVFVAEGGFVNMRNMMSDLINVLPSEWKDFCAKTKPEGDLVSLGAIKSYIKANLGN